MYTLLLSILIIDAIVLGAVILLQSGKGGGLAASFGGASSSSDSFLGARQTGNLLTTLSWWCGGIFLVLAFVLQLMSTRAAVPTSVLDRLSAPATEAVPVTPGGAVPALPLDGAPAGETPAEGAAPPAESPAPNN